MNEQRKIIWDTFFKQADWGISDQFKKLDGSVLANYDLDFVKGERVGSAEVIGVQAIDCCALECWILAMSVRLAAKREAGGPY